jgi:hypothetical protein
MKPPTMKQRMYVSPRAHCFSALFSTMIERWRGLKGKNLRFKLRLRKKGGLKPKGFSSSAPTAIT